MIRWLMVVFIILVLANSITPWLHRLGIGRLPGDFRFRLLGREWFIPLTSTVVLSLVAGVIAKVL